MFSHPLYVNILVCYIEKEEFTEKIRFYDNDFNTHMNKLTTRTSLGILQLINGIPL